jgi:hypothetical protein
MSESKMDGLQNDLSSGLSSRESFELMCFSYMCSSESDVTQRLKYTNKILLPESILYNIKESDSIQFPLFFKISNKETMFGQVCGVEEFSAPPGVCHIPYQVMNEISVQEGATVKIELFCPPSGTHVKFRFHKSKYLKMEDPKGILEKIMSSDYPVITQGQTIVLNDNGTLHYVDVVETLPTEVIQIINTNLNVDFDQPLDYKEPAPIKNCTDKVSEQIYKPWSNGFVPFSGKGYSLGSE